jgi:hypothetical protein
MFRDQLLKALTSQITFIMLAQKWKLNRRNNSFWIKIFPDCPSIELIDYNVLDGSSIN